MGLTMDLCDVCESQIESPETAAIRLKVGDRVCVTLCSLDCLYEYVDDLAIDEDDLTDEEDDENGDE